MKLTKSERLDIADLVSLQIFKIATRYPLHDPSRALLLKHYSQLRDKIMPPAPARPASPRRGPKKLP